MTEGIELNTSYKYKVGCKRASGTLEDGLQNERPCLILTESDFWILSTGFNEILDSVATQRNT